MACIDLLTDKGSIYNELFDKEQRLSAGVIQSGGSAFQSPLGSGN